MPWSNETDAKSDAENFINLVISRTESVSYVDLTSFSHQPKSPETDTNSELF